MAMEQAKRQLTLRATYKSVRFNAIPDFYLKNKHQTEGWLVLYPV